MRGKKHATRRFWVDPDDAPEGTKEQFERAEVSVGGELVRPAQCTHKRGRGRPRKADAKVHIHIRLSPQVLGHFRAMGPGWQTRIDEVLRDWRNRHGSRSRAPGKRARVA